MHGAPFFGYSRRVGERKRDGTQTALRFGTLHTNGVTPKNDPPRLIPATRIRFANSTPRFDPMECITFSDGKPRIFSILNWSSHHAVVDGLPGSSVFGPHLRARHG